MSVGNLHSQMRMYLENLEREFPNISRIDFLPSPQFVQKLKKLTYKINYALPKSFYSQQIEQFERELEDLYFVFEQNQFKEPTQYSLPDYIQRQKQPSDEEEALNFMASDEPPAPKPTISLIHKFLANFNSNKNERFINSGLIQINKNLIQSARADKYIEFNFIPIKKDSKFDKKQNKKQNKKNFYHKNDQLKESIKSPKVEKDKNKIQTILKLGDKIPLEVKQKRMELKKLSCNSFSVSSELSEAQLSMLERSKMNIRLILNKLAQDNADSLFVELSSYVANSEILCRFFIQILINKCFCQFEQIPFYSQFCCKFTRLKRREFDWEWKNPQKKKLNQFHRILVQKLEEEFKLNLESMQDHKLKSISKLIANLIKRRKLSKKIYHQMNWKLVSKIIQESSSASHQQPKIEACFESQMAIIEGLTPLYEEIWKNNSFQSSFLKQGFNVKFSSIPNTMEELLFFLNEHSKLTTTRIYCLLQNLVERKQTKVKAIEITTNQLSDQLLKAFRTSKLSEARKVVEQHSHEDIFKASLEIIYDGKKQQITKWIQILTELIQDTGEAFLLAWESAWRNLVFTECEYPFMIPAISRLAQVYLGKNRKMIVMQIEEDDEDFDECTYFMAKLEKEMERNNIFSDSAQF